MNNENEKEIQLSDILDSINTGFSKMEKRFNDLESDLESFKEKTLERFDKVDESIKEVNENIDGIVEDYHPRIIALDKKVFGHTTLE